jgi:uncharacterized protein (DUF488 family)
MYDADLMIVGHVSRDNIFIDLDNFKGERGKSTEFIDFGLLSFSILTVRIIAPRKAKKMKFFTIGYGGRKPKDFLDILKQKGIKAVVDVRLQPDRAYTAFYKKAKTGDKGIQHLLAEGGIEYFSLVELGNRFLGQQDWREQYCELLERDGDLMTERLQQVPTPFCLMCAEKSSAGCHRRDISDYLAKKGHEVEHIE